MTLTLSPSPPTSETYVLKMLSQGAPMTDVLNELCNFIGAKSPGVIPTVLLLDGDGLHLRLAAGPKVPKIWNSFLRGLQVPSYPSVLTTSGYTSKAVPVADMSSSPSFAPCWDLARSEGVRAAWSVPILSRDTKILGSLLLFCPTSHPPTDRDLELLEQATHMAAIAIECHRSEEELRKFSRRLYQSQDEERRRIARELHDSTGQKVAALQLSLSTIKTPMIAKPSEAENILVECVALASDISDELRTLSYLLHPPLLDECGLHTAVRWYAGGINQRQGLHVDVEIPEELCRLSEEAELTIFRIIQASLTNVHLHSGAGKARVQIKQNLNGVLLVVSDDGRGIPHGVLDHSSSLKSVGIGITGMRERVKQLGGHLEIETGCNGTIIKATVPSRHFRNLAPFAATQSAAAVG